MPAYETIRAALLSFLTDRRLEWGLVFYTPADWARLNWKVLDGALLVLCFEGSQIAGALEEDENFVQELTAELARLGCWYEQGHSWNLGVYADDCAQEIDEEAMVARHEA